MPELPEVETILRELTPHVKDRLIRSVDVLDTKTIGDHDPDDFVRALKKRRIVDLRRRGKYLVFELSEDRDCRLSSLVVHLKLTGALLLNPPSGTRFKRINLVLDSGDELLLSDPRRFGRMWITDNPAGVMCPLGPEPFSPAFSPAYFRERLAHRNAPIKSVLLDQKLVAGVGNMYADEALFTARINPIVKANALKKTQIDRLFKALMQVLNDGIRNKGASTRDYFRPDGERGSAHLEFKVAHRRGGDCLICGTPIKRIVVGQRGTYYCPRCQGSSSHAG